MRKVIKKAATLILFLTIFVKDMKIKLLGKTPDELKSVSMALGLPSFTGKQLAKWLYVRKAGSFDLMTDISKSGRQLLSEHYDVGLTAPSDCSVSSDGTKKYLFPVSCIGSSRMGADETASDDEFETSFVEAVMIPEEDRRTLCVSSQAGCRMDCSFCMTGRQGFHGNLSVSDILSQFIAIEESGSLTNAVFMGMGEPLNNYENVSRAIEAITADWGFGWSPKRVTVSTIGVLPVLEKFLAESRCHLAVSLHDPFGDERLSIMPVQKAYPLEDIIRLIREYDFHGQRRVSFEYTMFAGFNDSKRHADELIKMLKGLECRVNLIRFHRIPDFPYISSSRDIMESFRDRLNKAGIVCTIRASRGEDILAACGMLAGKHKNDMNT